MLVRSSQNRLMIEALRLVQVLGWSVAPGTYLAGGTCSCGNPRCDKPSQHPAEEDWAARATGERNRIEAWWHEQPRSSIVLPTGIQTDVLDLPAAAGSEVLGLLQRYPEHLGPVAATAEGRVQFFVQPGARHAMTPVWQRCEAERAQGLDWELRLYSRGEYVIAPPSGLGGPHAVGWLVSPYCREVGVRPLPAAGILLPLIAMSCNGHATRASA